jgi:hypothetical protein
MSLVLFACTIIGASILAQDIPAGLAPAPAAEVSARTLSVPDRNFRIDAPQGWRWLKVQRPKGQAAADLDGQVYVAQEPADDIRYGLVLARDPSVALTLDHGTADRIIAKAIEVRKAAGWKVRPATCASAASVQSGSFRCTFPATIPDGTDIFATVYILARGTQTYVLTYFSGDEQEADSFTAFVKSFRFLK